MKTVCMITTGGTIEKSYCDQTGKFGNIDFKIERYLEQIRLPHTHVEVLSLLTKDSLELTKEDRQLLLMMIRECLPSGRPIVITHGTDTMIETARELESNLPGLAVPIILTGAMTPLGFEHSDGIQNLAEGLLAAKLLPPGVHLVMHNEVFDIHHVRKDRDQRTFVHVMDSESK
jgi:L-asparaginase